MIIAKGPKSSAWPSTRLRDPSDLQPPPPQLGPSEPKPKSAIPNKLTKDPGPAGDDSLPKSIQEREAREKILNALKDPWKKIRQQHINTPIKAVGGEVRVTPQPQLVAMRSDKYAPSRRLFEESTDAAVTWVTHRGELRVNRLEQGKSRWLASAPILYEATVPIEQTANGVKHDALTQIPLTAELARKVPVGTRLVLRGGGNYRAIEAVTDSAPWQDVTLMAFFVKPKHARISLEYVPGQTNQIVERLRELLAGSVDLDTLSPKLGGNFKFRFGEINEEGIELDLSTPEGAELYEKLLKLEPVELSDEQIEERDFPKGITDATPKRVLNGSYSLGYKTAPSVDADISILGVKVRAGVGLSTEQIAADNPLVREDVERYNYLLNKREQGETVRWLRTVGQLRPEISTSLSLPTPVSPFGGARVARTIRYAFTSGYARGIGGDLTNIARTLDSVLANPAYLANDDIPPGTEVACQIIDTFEAYGGMEASTSPRVGIGLEFGVRAGYRHTIGRHSVERTVIFRKRSDGTLAVSIRAHKQTGNDDQIHLSAGLLADAGDMFTHRSADGGTEAWVDEIYGQALTRLADRGIERLTRIRAQKTLRSDFEVSDGVDTFGPFNLNNPKEKEAFDKLLCGPPITQPNNPYWFQTYNAQGKAERTPASIEISLFDILKSNRHVSLMEGVRRTRDGTFKHTAGIYEFPYTALDDLDARFHVVATDDPDVASVAVDIDLRTYDIDHDTMRAIHNIATKLHIKLLAVDKEALSEEDAELFFLLQFFVWLYYRIFLTRDVRTSIRFFITPGGLDRIRKASRQDVIGAYLRAMNAFGLRPDQSQAMSDPTHPHRKLLEKVLADPEVVAPNLYRHAFNRELQEDVRMLRDAKAFADAIAKSQNVPTKQWVHALTALGAEALDEMNSEPTDTFRTLTALCCLAGRNNIQVAELFMEQLNKPLLRTESDPVSYVTIDEQIQTFHQQQP